MPESMSILHLILNAGYVVQFVMLMLMLASVMSWTMIIDRSRKLKQANEEADQFEQRFWSGGDLGELYSKMNKQDRDGMSAIFVAGFQEYMRLRENASIDPMALVAGSQRAMRVAFQREMDKLETHLSFLATVGSTSPYVGLFGTVWGIMNAFTSLANVKQATLQLVAPGIAEALIATAMGLFAAIPAVIAYNRFAAETERLGSRYDSFLEEFSSILQRQAHH